MAGLDKLLEYRRKTMEQENQRKRLIQEWKLACGKKCGKAFKKIKTLYEMEIYMSYEIKENKKHADYIIKVINENQDLVKATLPIQFGFKKFLI